MTTILRKEWFGGIIGNTKTYDIRVINRFTYSMLAENLRTDNQLNTHHRALFNSAGYQINNENIRLVQHDIFSDTQFHNTPILSAPIILWFELTSACPLKCKHCFIDCNQNDNLINLPFAYVKKILQEADDLGVMRVTLSGGEAFSYPFIEQTIEEINGLDFGLRIFTNGVINKKNLSWLNKYTIDTLFLSIDGPQEHHDFLRGKNTFSHLVKSLEFFSSLNSIKNITFSISLDRYNVEHFSEIITLGARYGVSTFLLRPLMGYSWTEEIKNLIFKEKTELLYALRKIEELTNKYHIECQINKIPYMPINKYQFIDDHQNNASLWNILGLNESIDCVGGNLVCGIRYDGIISPCGFINIEYQTNQSNSIYNKTLSELWRYSSNLNKMRNIKLNNFCRSCNIIKICNGGCRANSYNISQNISGLDPYCLYQKTAYGKNIFNQKKLMQLSNFPLDEKIYFISNKRLVSKCGWATYE